MTQGIKRKGEEKERREGRQTGERSETPADEKETR